MPRIIRDEYELADYDELPDEGKLRRYTRRSPIPLIALLLFGACVAIAAGTLYSRVIEAQNEDAGCLRCHTVPHAAYASRAESAVAGGVAADLASFHTQQIRGQGGNIKCIDCHRGSNSRADRIRTVALSARISLGWLTNAASHGIERAGAVITSTAGITTYIGSAALLAPALSNDGCVACHQQTLLTAGIVNHYHNTLPVSYGLWRDGARLTAPDGVTDAQAVVARGLTRYATSVQCSDCHQAHRSSEEEKFLHKPTVDRTCIQCHTEAGVTVPQK